MNFKLISITNKYTYLFNEKYELKPKDDESKCTYINPEIRDVIGRRYNIRKITETKQNIWPHIIPELYALLRTSSKNGIPYNLPEIQSYWIKNEWFYTIEECLSKDDELSVAQVNLLAAEAFASIHSIPLEKIAELSAKAPGYDGFYKKINIDEIMSGFDQLFFTDNEERNDLRDALLKDDRFVQLKSSIRDKLKDTTRKFHKLNLPTYFLYGDFHQGNYFITNAKLSLFDWDECRLDVRLFDFSRYFAIGPGSNYRTLESLDSFVDTYNEHIQDSSMRIGEEEKNFLPDMILLDWAFCLNFFCKMTKWKEKETYDSVLKRINQVLNNYDGINQLLN